MSQFFSEHYAAISLAAIYFLIAAVSAMPEKGAQWNAATVYAWIYDIAHMLVNVATKKYPLASEDKGTNETATAETAAAATKETK